MKDLKPVKNFDDYYVSKNGEIFSTKSGELRKLKPYVDTTGRYLMIRLIGNDGLRKSLLIHRIVAETFIPNPDNLPEVNHKDNNPQNPKAENLEWCTRKYNMEYSHITDNPVKNYNPCKLYKDDILIDEFESILAAVRFAKKNYDIKPYQLEKHLQSKDIKIVPERLNRKNKAS